MKNSDKIQANSVTPYVVRNYGRLIFEIRVDDQAENTKQKVLMFQNGKK